MRIIKFLTHPDIRQVVYDEERRELTVLRLNRPPIMYGDVQPAVVKNLVGLPIPQTDRFMKALSYGPDVVRAAFEECADSKWISA